MSDQSEARGRRTAAILAVILVLLLLLLCGVGYFFVRILVPAGNPEDAVVTEGMTWIRSIYGFGPSADEQLLGPTSVAVAPNGRIYVTDPQRARVLAFNPDGVYNGIIHTGMGGTGEGQLGRPQSVDCDDDGNVYIADTVNAKIMVFDDNYQFVQEWPVPGITALEVTGDTVYTRELGEVVAYTLEGTERSRFGERGRGFGAVLEPTGGLTADDDVLYVADSLNQAVKAFSLEGDFLWSQPAGAEATAAVTPEAAETDAAASETTTTTADGAEGQPVDLPADAALDANGALYVVDAFSFQILRVDNETGEVLRTYGRDGQNDAEFMYPSGIDYDQGRDWFVIADTANNRVQIVRIDGTGGGLAQAAQRSLSSPFRVCAIPLLALLLILLLIILTRRRRRADTSGETTLVEVVEPDTE